MDVTDRLAAWVVRTFPADRAAQVLDELRGLPGEVIGGQAPERVQAACVIRSGGSWEELQAQLALVRVDWRDALVNAGLAGPDWPDVLDDTLGGGGARSGRWSRPRPGRRPRR